VAGRTDLFLLSYSPYTPEYANHINLQTRFDIHSSSGQLFINVKLKVMTIFTNFPHCFISTNIYLNERLHNFNISMYYPFQKNICNDASVAATSQARVFVMQLVLLLTVEN
jgi:hypothetical protein